jgi:cytoskeletal protein RodZ
MIGPRHLQAIEEGQLEHLPEPIYIRGFIRRFANALGLNGVELASDFPVESNQRLLNYSWINWPSAQWRPIHLYILYIVLIMCSVQGLSQMLDRPILQASRLDIEPPPPAKPVQQQERRPAPSQAKLTAKQSPTPSPAAGAVRIGLTLKAESWIEVVADGQTQFQGILPEGTKRTWEAKQELFVKAGNAGGVLMAVNDGQAKQMGAPGKVEEVTVKANPES